MWVSVDVVVFVVMDKSFLMVTVVFVVLVVVLLLLLPLLHKSLSTLSEDVSLTFTLSSSCSWPVSNRHRLSMRNVDVVIVTDILFLLPSEGWVEDEWNEWLGIRTVDMPCLEKIFSFSRKMPKIFCFVYCVIAVGMAGHRICYVVVIVMTGCYCYWYVLLLIRLN